MVPKLVPKIGDLPLACDILSLFFTGVMTKQTLRRLSDTKLRNIAPNSKPITSPAVAGLIFVPSTSTKGTGAWVLRYYNKTLQKRQKVTVGHYPLMSIVEAEAEANKLKAGLKTGLDPKLEKQKSKDLLTMDQENTFQAVAEEYFATAKQQNLWKNEKNEKNWKSRMQNFVYPTIGHMPITQIKARHLTFMLQDIWNKKAYTASRVLRQVSRVFRWAGAMDYHDQNPCEFAREALGPQKVQPMEERSYPALPWKDIPVFFKVLFEDQQLRIGKYALMFLILNACRPGSIRFMQIQDISQPSGYKLWILAPERENSKVSLREYYPLSTQSQRILQHVRYKFLSTKYNPVGQDSLVFPGRFGNALSDMALTTILRRQASGFQSDKPGREITVHGFRSTFRGWATINGYDDRLIERQLTHKIGSTVQRAYDREMMVEERRVMMQAWADYCFSEITDFDSLFLEN